MMDIFKVRKLGPTLDWIPKKCFGKSDQAALKEIYRSENCLKMATIIKSSSKSDDSRAIGKPTQSLIWNFMFFGHAKNFNLNYCPHWPIINLLDNFTWIGCLLPTHHQCLTVTSSSNTIFWLLVSNSWIRWRHKSSTCKKAKNKLYVDKITILYLIYDVLKT